MKITICGSVAFIKEMEIEAEKLEALGHEVKFPPTTKSGQNGEPIPTLEYYKYKKEAAGKSDHWIWKTHDDPIRAHFNKVAWSDAILVLNFDKNGVSNYIGPNTLMEMGLAFYLNKKIYLLNPIPNVPWYEEIIGMKPICINGDYSELK